MIGPLDREFKPGPNRIFVFGSNLAGIHGKGAALDALRLYGAVYGVGEGLRGNSYALPTKDAHLRRLPLDAILGHVNRFKDFARTRLDLQFFVTRIGCGLAGYKDIQIAPMFYDLPENCELPRGWEK